MKEIYIKINKKYQMLTASDLRYFIEQYSLGSKEKIPFSRFDRNLCEFE